MPRAKTTQRATAFGPHTVLTTSLIGALALAGCHGHVAQEPPAPVTRVETPAGKAEDARILAQAAQAADAAAAAADAAATASPERERKAANPANTGKEIASLRSRATRADAERSLETITVTGGRLARAETTVAADHFSHVQLAPPAPPAPPPPAPAMIIGREALMTPANTERYAEREDNPVHRTSEQPVSTFSIDVDTGSYSNVRRMLRDGARPPADAVRAEEMINYFDYGHPGPSSLATPFKVNTELATAPWNGKRQLLMIGIKGYDVAKAELPPANLVFLIDTSGSMQSADKLPLLKQSFAQLVEQLRPQDRVSMVVYAGSAGVVLEPTPGDDKAAILGALDKLQAGGSTNGGQGIELAYAMAKQAYAKTGVNRVILATDGDFNVGITDRKALETLVGDQRKHGIALTTLGFGQGNYNDAMAERLADVGDGNHAYIDTLQEARKVLVQEMQSTLLTIARDVKIQIEFNPAQVAEYRLIGYENRLLAREDFANDKVDAGDIGAGHEVTALYEITRVDSDAQRLPALRYGKAAPTADGGANGELAHLRLRYKRPGEDTSRLIERPVQADALRTTPSATLRFAATVAAYADALRGGKHIDRWSWEDIARSARDTRGADPWHERAEFIELVEAARRVTAGDAPQVGMIAD